MEIEQRLGLYQVFLKLYEHHPNLLDEILQLEKTSNKVFSGVTTRCITGIIQGQQVYLVTNLVDGKTQSLHQPQGIWTIGRDRLLSISIPDLRLSRRHAVIQYIHDQGFYLVDLESTNGSFVNGEPVHGRLLLKDGDRIRLSSLAFSFFLCNDCQTLADTPSDILEKLKTTIVTPTLTTIEQSTPEPLSPAKSPNIQKTELAEQQEETFEFLQNLDSLKEEPAFESSISQLSSAQQSEILDRFFSRQIEKISKLN
jgi:pSer/pThr/pTyr-binding forkhead associated (FHA) protein